MKQASLSERGGKKIIEIVSSQKLAKKITDHMVYLSNMIYEIGELSQFQNFHQSKGTLIQKNLTKVIC